MVRLNLSIARYKRRWLGLIHWHTIVRLADLPVNGHSKSELSPKTLDMVTHS